MLHVVHFGQGVQGLHCQHRIVRGLAVDGQAAGFGVILRARLGALLVAQHRDALGRQAAGDVEERAVRPDRLVAVVRTGAVHEHEDGRLFHTARQCEGCGQYDTAAADGQCEFVELRRIDIRRDDVGRCRPVRLL